MPIDIFILFKIECLSLNVNKIQIIKILDFSLIVLKNKTFYLSLFNIKVNKIF